MIADADLPSLVAAAGALGFVSTKEGFGFAAMEALVAGVPVVARDLPVLREVFADAVRYAVDPRTIVAHLGAVLASRPDPSAGQRLAGSFTWDAAAVAHVDLYHQVLAAR